MRRPQSQMHLRTWTTELALLALAICLAGCPEKRAKPEPREVVGTVEEIDLANNRVKVQSYIEKHEKYETFTVLVTEDTEILINGSLASLRDVRIGERAEGTVEVTRQDGKTVLTALAVSIERGEVLSAPGADGHDQAAAEGNRQGQQREPDQTSNGPPRSDDHD